MTDSAQVKSPKPPKPYPVRCPRVGEVVYVPTATGAQRHVVGGRAVVATVDDASRRSKRLTVVEHPGETYSWSDLVFLQSTLYQQFGSTPARMPTDWERVALAAARDADRAATAEARAAAEKEERDRWLPQRFQVMNGGLLDVPIWGTHHRCRNWGAIITLAPEKPGGIDRWWFNRGAGPVKYIVPGELEVHDPIEFGADYIRGSGYRDPERWYGVVLESEPDHLLVEPCVDALQALTLSAERQRALSQGHDGADPVAP